MLVTKVEPVSIKSKRFRVELDEEFAFVLYKGELSHYRIKEGNELTEEVCQKIRSEIILKRAKLRALHLLNDSAKSEAGLREKLIRGLYPADIVDQAIDYVKKFGYLDDLAYAKNFIESRKGSKSRKEIYAALLGKGVESSVMEQAMEEVYGTSDEKEAIRRLMQKRHFDALSASSEAILKEKAFYARKGFRYEDICKAFDESQS